MKHSICTGCEDGMPWFQMPCPACKCPACLHFRGGDQSVDDAFAWMAAVGIPIDEAVFSDIPAFRAISRDEIFSLIELGKEFGG